MEAMSNGKFILLSVSKREMTSTASAFYSIWLHATMTETRNDLIGC